MPSDKSKGQGEKAHEQFLRNLERKDDVPKAREAAQMEGRAPPLEHREASDPQARQSELAVSRGGMNQESRDHNKHNNQGQQGHRPQKHSPAEEKQ